MLLFDQNLAILLGFNVTFWVLAYYGVSLSSTIAFFLIALYATIFVLNKFNPINYINEIEI
jgi:hypothetical protein